MPLTDEDRERLAALHEKQERKRQEEWDRRMRASVERIKRGSESKYALLMLRVDQYFKDKYGDRWRQRMEALRK